MSGPIEGVSRPGCSEITSLNILRTIPIGSYGAIPYVRLEGEAIGELDLLENIPGITLAARLDNGRVQYRTKFVLITPKEPIHSQGVLLVDVPNRGLPISHAFYNSPRSRPLMIGSLDAGLGFLQEQGFMVLCVQWELGQGFEPPRFVDEQGQTRYVEAAGFAAVRDMVIFLRENPTVLNPLASVVQHTIAVGYSQTSRFLKSYLLNGFNTFQDKQVMNGLHLVGGAAGQLPLMAVGKGPGSVAASTPGPATPEHRSVHEEPFVYSDVLSMMTARRESLPKLFVTHYNMDYLGGRASLTRTGAKEIKELSMHPVMRMYDIAGAAHLNIRQQDSACTWMHGQLDWSAPLRAQLFTLSHWVKFNTEPPETCVMKLRKPFPGESVFTAPDYLPKAQVLVPETDEDGNPIGGVRMPDIAVPLGTHGRPNAPMSETVCRLAGSYQPFHSTRTQRATSSDQRLSLEERYPGGLNDYLAQIRAVCHDLIVARHLLPADAAVIINAAAEEKLLLPTPTLRIFR